MYVPWDDLKVLNIKKIDIIFLCKCNSVALHDFIIKNWQSMKWLKIFRMHELCLLYYIRITSKHTIVISKYFISIGMESMCKSERSEIKPTTAKYGQLVIICYSRISNNNNNIFIGQKVFNITTIDIYYASTIMWITCMYSNLKCQSGNCFNSYFIQDYR